MSSAVRATAAAAVIELLAEFLGTPEWSELLPGVAQIAPEVWPIVVEAPYGQHPG
jgi:hypothetical protein